MSRLIPNSDSVGNDSCLTPVEVRVPFIIVDNGNDCFWFHEPMDPSAAQRLAFSISQSAHAEAFSIDVRLVLPAACDIRAATSELDCISSQPVRAILQVNEKERVVQ